jgi:hypothetical protein
MVARQPRIPEPSVFSTPLQQKREGRPLFAEHNGVPVHPDVPQAQEHERGGIVRRDGSRSRKLEQTTNVGLRRQLDANLVPESPHVLFFLNFFFLIFKMLFQNFWKKGSIVPDLHLSMPNVLVHTKVWSRAGSLSSLLEHDRLRAGVVLGACLGSRHTTLT